MKVSFSIIKSKFPEATIYLYSNFSKNLTGFSQKDNYNLYIRKILEEEVEVIDWTYEGNFDLIFHGGGGIYFDYEEGGKLNACINFLCLLLGAHYVSKVDSFLRWTFRKPRRVGTTKKVGAGIGIGTYPKRSKMLYRHMADIGAFDALYVRDTFSFDSLKELKFKGRKGHFSDLAFLHDTWSNEKILGTGKGPKTIGITLMDWHVGSGFLYKQATKFALKARQKGYAVIFFSCDENHDKEYINCFRTEHVLVWRPNKIRLDEYIYELSKCDIMVTARAHGATLGSCLGALPVCINISKKLQTVANMFPNSSSLIEKNYNADQWLEEIENISERWIKAKELLKEDVKRNVESVKHCISELNNSVL